MRLGIPRAFLFYRYQHFWNKFFTLLGFNVLYSDLTDKRIVENGKMLAMSEDCLSTKIFLGHVKNLVNKCDYILVPRFESYGLNNVTCTKFNGLYDIVRTSFPDLKIIFYNIDKLNGVNEYDEILRMAKDFCSNEDKIRSYYLLAKNYQWEIENLLFEEQNKKLLNDKKRILIVAHPYNIHDNFIGMPIVHKLESLGFDVLFSDYVIKKQAVEYSKSFSKELYWLFNKELIGAIKYYDTKVDGIVFLSSFPCGCDALVNDLVMRKIKLPVLNLVVDEHQDMGGFDTRLESFADVINMGISI